MSRRQTCVEFEQMAESGVADIEFFGYLRHPYITLHSLLNILFCPRHQLRQSLLRACELIAVHCHKHQAQNMIDNARKQLLEERGLTTRNIYSLAVELLHLLIIAYTIDRSLIAKEAALHAIIYILATKAYPIFAPTTLCIGLVSVPLPGKNHKHILYLGKLWCFL